MRRLAIAAALIGGSVFVVRAFAPKLHARMLAACKGMFEQMPDDFPPKRMMGGIEEIRANSARTLALLEERKQADEAAPLAEASSTRADEMEMVPA
jgi:hypothetical protein